MYAGGLEFSLHNIGTALGVVGVMMIPISLLAFNPVSDNIENNMLYEYCYVNLMFLWLVYQPSCTG